MRRIVIRTVMTIAFSLTIVSRNVSEAGLLPSASNPIKSFRTLHDQELVKAYRALDKYVHHTKLALYQQKMRMTIGFGGDVFMHIENIDAAWSTRTNTYDFAPPFEKIKALISQPDFTACALGANYEDSPPYSGYPLFITPVQLLYTIKSLGFDIVFATNHIFDGGEQGFLKRNRYLEQLNIKHPGEFATEKASQEILVLRKGSIRAALLSYTYGTNGIPVTRPYMVNLITKKKMRTDLDKAKALKVDFIIVYLHQGEEYEQAPSSYQQQTALFLAEQGVDVIISSHPHVIQPGAVIRTPSTEAAGFHTTYILTYSLGNLYCAQWQPHTQTGLFISMIIEKPYHSHQANLKNVYITPTYTLIRETDNGNVYKIYPLAQTLKNYQEGKETDITEAEARKMLAEWKNTIALISDPRLPIVIR